LLVSVLKRMLAWLIGIKRGATTLLYNKYSFILLE